VKTLQSARRVMRISITAARYRLDALVTPFVSERFKWLLRCSPLQLIGEGDRGRGERLKLALEELGPVFVKFGQMVSTRRDLVPHDIADALASLQDSVPPFPSATARQLLTDALDCPIEEVFSAFEDQPLASASVAQVHAATLRTGEDVVVKIVRPGINQVIRDDIEMLKSLAEFLQRHITDAGRLHLPEVVADYETTIFNELDMGHEAANTEKLRGNFAGSPLLYVPRVFREHCRQNILVLERIYGVPISDIAELHRRNTDLRLLAERGVETFFTQVFEDNFFHADMHPGNIFVNVDDPQNPSYIAVDCAIIGSLTRSDQTYLARNLLAFFNRDYSEVVRLHLESGWIPEGTDSVAFERVIREVCEPIFAKPLNEISFGQFLLQLFQTAREFDMEIQPQLVLLQKTLLYIEGLGRELYPQLDLWQTAKPFMERWMTEHLGPAAALREFAEHAPALLDQLPELPGALLSAVSRLKSLERTSRRHASSLALLQAEVTRVTRRRRIQRVSGTALLIVAALLLFEPIAQSLNNGDDLGTSAGLVSALAGALLLLRS